MRAFQRRIERLCSEEDGQDLLEYTLLLAFLALATFLLLTGVSQNISALWTTANTSLSSAKGVAS